MAVTVDYTTVNITDDGTTFGTAVRTAFQATQSDLGNRPEKSEDATITGDRTFHVNSVLRTNGYLKSFGILEINGVTDCRSEFNIDNSYRGYFNFISNPVHTGACTFADDITFNGGAKLHAPGATGDVTVAEITMDEVASGNASQNGIKIVKENGGNKIQFIPVFNGVEKSGERLEYIFSAKAWKFADDAIVIMRSLRYATTPPTTASSAGFPGDIAWDSNYIYQCVAINTWKRTAISSW